MDFLSKLNPFAPIIDKTFGIIDKAVKDKDLALKLKTDIQKQTIETQHKVLGIVKEVLSTEMSGNWLQRSWRPITMLSFVFMIFWNYWIAPVFGLPSQEIPEQMWQLINLGLGGYVVGRSVEKGIKEYKKP